MSNLLFNEPPLVVSPTLACVVGLHEAIVLQQFHYWTAHSKIVHEDRRWIYNTYQEWAIQFPFWKPETIRKIVANLRAKGLVDVKQLSTDKANRTNYYAINYGRLDEINPSDTHTEKSTACPSGKNHRTLNRKNPPVHAEESTGSLYRTETTTENTETTGASRPSLPEWLDPQLWSRWVAFRKRKDRMAASEDSKNLWIRSMTEVHDAGHDVKASVERSIANNWAGIFAPRTDTVIGSRTDTKSLDKMDYSEALF